MNSTQAEVVDPRLTKGLMLDLAEPLPLEDDASIEDIRATLLIYEQEIVAGGESLVSFVPVNNSITQKIITTTGVDNNEIKMYASYPEDYETSTQSYPCIFYIHGGGMAIYSANGPFYRVFAHAAVATVGAIVVAVEYRTSVHGHVFPAGLNDCKSALDWVIDNKESQRISRVIACGESGGANLSAALVLLAKREGQGHYVDGVYAHCPYVSGQYNPAESEEAKQFPSLRKNDDCGIVTLKGLHFTQRLYDPENQHTRNPLAWPLWASPEELTGLPPFAITLNEADPLYDQGLAFYRKLRAAGVRTVGRTVLGTCHAGDFLSVLAAPDLYRAMLYDIKAFVDGLL
eukprot:gene14483-16627_t